MDETIEIGIRAQMYKELAQYVASKRKAIGVKGEAGQSFIDALREANSRRDIPDYDACLLFRIYYSLVWEIGVYPAVIAVRRCALAHAYRRIPVQIDDTFDGISRYAHRTILL